MATVHLVCGPIAAGKTTYSRKLALELGAVRFSLDEWVVGLFGKTLPEPMNIEWWTEHCELCRERIWTTCCALLPLHVDVILDFGLPDRASRERYRGAAQALGAAARLHVVEAERALRRERNLRRNREQGETYALQVSEPMFDGAEPWWEPPTADELAAYPPSDR